MIRNLTNNNNQTDKHVTAITYNARGYDAWRDHPGRWSCLKASPGRGMHYRCCSGHVAEGQHDIKSKVGRKWPQTQAAGVQAQLEIFKNLKQQP